MEYQAMTETADAPRFQVFKKRDAKSEAEITVMEYAAQSPAVMDGGKRAIDAGIMKGSELKLLFEAPGFSLIYAWFKSGYPLPRHAHNCDCLYYVVAGSLKMGREELGPGDGFFVGKDVPYTYRAGASGVEVLEFRATNTFDIKVLAENPLFWEDVVKTAVKQQPAWNVEKPPSLSQ
jgi:mannose-6-phosphate isomerase-like protein (cupin superfamily)